MRARIRRRPRRFALLALIIVATVTTSAVAASRLNYNGTTTQRLDRLEAKLDAVQAGVGVTTTVTPGGTTTIPDPTTSTTTTPVTTTTVPGPAAPTYVGSSAPAVFSTPAASLLTAGNIGSPGTSQTTASVTPTANALLLASVYIYGGSTTHPTMSGNGLTWVEEKALVHPGSGAYSVYVFRAMGSSPAAGAATISLPAAQDDLQWSITQYTGVATSGTNGSGAVVQSVSNNAVGASSVTITLSAFASANNVTYAALGSDVNEAFTAGSSMTKLTDTNFSGGGGGHSFVETAASAVTSVGGTKTSTSGRIGGIAIEVAAAPYTISVPAASAAGDFMLMGLVARPANTASLTCPTGWTAVPSGSVFLELGTNDLKVDSCYRFKVAGDDTFTVTVPAAYDGAGAGYTAAVAAWRGVSASAPFDVTATTDAATAALTWAAPSITPISNNAIVVSLVGTADDNAVTALTPQGFTPEWQGAAYDTTDGGDMSIALADKTVATPAAVTAPTWQQSVNGPDAWAGVTIALRPGGASGAGGAATTTTVATTTTSTTSTTTTTTPGASATATSNRDVIAWAGCGRSDQTGLETSTDAELAQIKARGFDGIICSGNYLAGSGGDDEWYPGSNLNLIPSSTPYAFQRKLRDAAFVARAHAAGLKVYLGWYAASYYNDVTPFVSDWFDDGAWASPTRGLVKMADAAAALHNLGFDGIAFDTELTPNYSQTGIAASWSTGFRGNTHTAAETRAQVYLRGQQVAQTFQASMPGLEVRFYGSYHPGGSNDLAQQTVNNIVGAYNNDTFWDLLAGMASVTNFSKMVVGDASWYKGNIIGSLTGAAQLDLNTFAAFMSNKVPNWSAVSSKVLWTEMIWLTAGADPFEADRGHTANAALLNHVRLWSSGDIVVYWYGRHPLRNAGDLAVYDREATELLSASTPVAIVDAAPALTNLAVASGVLSGRATDDYAVRRVTWAANTGESGAVKLTWTPTAGDVTAGYTWRMDLSAVVPTGKTITLTVEDNHGQTATATVSS